MGAWPSCGTRDAGTWRTGSRRSGITCRSRYHLARPGCAPNSTTTAPLATLDVGCIGPAGFRGWSGGARRSFVITAAQATPGYLPGELEPGTWQVMIGLYQMPVDGIEYRLTAEVTGAGGGLAPEPQPGPVPPLAQRPPRRDLPAAAGHRWLAGDLHTHTVHSDGAMTVSELARFAVGQGLDFIAITDHNTISHHAELPAAAAAHQIILVPGQEVTTDRGSCERLRRPGLDRLPPERGLLAGGHRARRRAAVGQPPDRRSRELDHAHDPAAAADRGLALELARSALDQLAGLVAGLGSGRDPGRRQRLAPARFGRSARLAHHLDRGGSGAAGCAAGRPAGRPYRHLRHAGTARCCSGSMASWSRPVPRAPSWPARTARSPWSAARWRAFPARPGCHRLIDATGATLALTP